MKAIRFQSSRATMMAIVEPLKGSIGSIVPSFEF